MRLGPVLCLLLTGEASARRLTFPGSEPAFKRFSRGNDSHKNIDIGHAE